MDLQTIVCYLTLPKKQVTPPVFAFSQDEKEYYGRGSLEAVQSCFVEIPTADEQAKRKRQFSKAMSALGLKPYVHPSQLQRTISTSGDPETKTEQPSGTVNGSEDGNGPQGKDSETSTASRPAGEMATWPRLIQMVSATMSL